MTTPKTASDSTASAAQESENPKPKRKPIGGKGNQPKTQASKSRAVVKQRRKKIIKALVEGKTQQEAGIIAGFKPESARSQVAQTLAKPSVQSMLLAALEKNGLTDDYLALKHRALIEGTKVISATVIQGPGSADLKDAGSMTKDFIEVPDNAALAKGLELAYKLKGALTDKHEVEVKQPPTIIIKKFCSRGQNPADSATPGGPQS